MRHKGILIFLSFLIMSPLFAQSPRTSLDPESNQPYRWRIAYQLSTHPIFSDSFREEFSRQLLAFARNQLGDLGTAEVIDLSHDSGDELCQQFVIRGWAAIDANPDYKHGVDPARQLTGRKTHFLNIQYRNGVFTLEARQHDGFSGLASPILRKETTRILDMLPRLAGLMMEPDFGPVGTMIPIIDETEKVTVSLRGSGVGPVDRWVKAGDIFAVSVIKEIPKPLAPGQAAPERRSQIPMVRVGKEYAQTLLRALEPAKNGQVTCSVVTHFREDYAFGVEYRAKRALGIRCMKLPTIEAPLQVRLLNKGGVPHQRGSQLQVAASENDFKTVPGPEGQFEQREGLFRSTKSFPGLACVRVSIGADAPRLFPVAILSTEPIPLLFELKPEDEKRAEFASRCNELRARIADVSTGQLALLESVYKQIDIRQIRAALAEAEKGYARVNESQQALSEELKKVRSETGAADNGAKGILDDCEKELTALNGRQDRFTKIIGDLKTASAASNSPAQLDKEFRAKEMLERIKEKVARGDIPEALELYGKLIELVPEDRSLKDAREKLQGEWSVKDEEHRKAREAIRNWQMAQTAEDYVSAVAKLMPAIEVMNRKKDRLGLRKLLNTFEPAIVTLNNLITAADAQTEDGAKSIKDLQKVVEEIRKIATSAESTLKRLLAETK